MAEMSPKPVSLLRRAAEAMLAVSMFGMVCAVFLNVVLRYLFNTGLAGYEEISRLLFVWLVCIGAVLATVDNQHLRFDLVVDRLPAPARLLCRWLSRLLIGWALYHLLVGAWAQILVGIDSRSPVLGYPLGLAAAAVFTMAACMALLLLREMALELFCRRAAGCEPASTSSAK
ncbi:TRAP transporter small permease [Zobellella taiwanensis]|uniref:TRAP transporter small permease protein n=2 Tax=Zobellella taiwanensis TaxID=347535 RepID=A0A2P7QML5_9GAMM|nr:TRAP transporter small permease [Zobellella taiwanensis]